MNALGLRQAMILIFLLHRSATTYQIYLNSVSNFKLKSVFSAGSPLGGKMSRRKSFRQSNWLIELSPRKNVEPRIVGLRSTFRGSTFFRLVEIRL